MFAKYDYSVMIGWCLEYMFIQAWLVDVWNIWIINHGWCCLCWGSTVCISGINYHGLFSSSVMECRVFKFGVYDIWLWRSCCIALHCIALPYMAFGVMSRTYGCDRTGTTSIIGHNDAASYLVGYEDRSSYSSICIHYLFGMETQLHTLMGMKVGVHLHWYACFFGLMLDVMEVCIYKHILCPYGDMHCNVAYES